MDARIVGVIAKQIHRQFPELAGEPPSVRAQAGAKGSAGATYLLTFKGRPVAQGPNLAPTVRVVANTQGHILKVTTSR
ncbi:MAG: hypothetical protein KIT07_06750 [Anaerolineales bacterium]|jgi:hypothetical protein|nr:hypothetical protein [Anaerolineales bacterium]